MEIIYMHLSFKIKYPNMRAVVEMIAIIGLNQKTTLLLTTKSC